MNDPRLAVHAVVTQSHECLLNEWFLRTLPSDCRPVLHLLEAKPSVFREGHWHEIFIYRVQVVLDILAATPKDEIFVMSDVDIQFFHPIAADLRQRSQGRHLLFQNNQSGRSDSILDLCAGFAVIRSGEIAQRFFIKALAVLKDANHPEVDDQISFHDIIRAYPETHATLLPDTYWTNSAMWSPGDPVDPPRSLFLHHANWVLGVENKIKQLEVVRNIVESMREATIQ